ncbi:hypothetical protein P9597_14780 [Aneurinibacillus migulanus]|uniref:hypothetical protein n=1 Tax=Aneurinibacillus migulanus TaxID=47500 RepID=UPI002E21ACD4|nr:hypothetical protein [Aneurinibacillus migulanus]
MSWKWFNSLTKKAAVQAQKFTQSVNKAASAAKQKVTQTVSAVKKTVSSAVTAVKKTVSKAVTAVKQKVTKTVAAIKKKVANAVTAVKKKLVQAKKLLQSAVKATKAATKKLLTKAKAAGRQAKAIVKRQVGKVFTDARKLKNNLTLYERIKKLKRQMKQQVIVTKGTVTQVSVEANPVRVASAYSPVYTPKVSDLLKLWDTLGEEGERYVKEKKYYPSKEKFLFPLQLIGPRSGGGTKGAGKGTSPKSNSFSGTADELLHIVKNSPKSTRIGLQDKVAL